MLDTRDFVDRLDRHHQAVVALPISSPTTGAVQTVRALIDTGANASGISQRVVDSLGLHGDETQSVVLSVRTVAGEVAADGFVVHVHPPTRADQPGLQPEPGISAVVSLLEMPATGFDALIGMDVMRHVTRQVLFDFEAGEFKIVWNN